MHQEPHPAATTVEDIYRVHSAFLWRVARTRGIPVSMIPDVLQDIFVTVLRRLPFYEEQGSLKGWLYTIADGHIRQFFRSEGRRQRRMTLIARSVDGVDDGSALVDNLQRSEASRLVQRFIDELTANLREIFLLCCVEGLPGIDVARLLNLNINTLYSREKAARRRFQAFIQNIHTLEERRP